MKSRRRITCPNAYDCADRDLSDQITAGIGGWRKTSTTSLHCSNSRTGMSVRGHKPRRRLGPGASLCPQCLQSRRNFVHLTTAACGGFSQNVGVKVEKNSKEIETEIAENCLVYYIASCPPISRQLPPRGGRTTYGEGVGRGWQRTDKGKKKPGRVSHPNFPA